MQSTLLSRAVGYADMAIQARRWSKSTDETVAENARAHLAARMGRLRGLPQKVGQILGMSDDAEKASAFGYLSDQADPLAFDEVAPILCDAWGRDISAVARSIDADARAASLGQVHRGVLRDGRMVAVKVQYPGVRQAVMNDLRFLGWLSAPVGDLRKGFDLSGYRAEILRDLEDELDYRIEANYQKKFDALTIKVPGWTVPRVIEELSSERVLVSEWLDGESIETAASWPQAVRYDLSIALVRGFLWQLFRFGRIHADPHPGNYRFIKSDTQSQVLLYDFGSVAELSPNHATALLKLIEITMLKEGDPYKPLVAIGFKEALLRPIREKLAALCTTLFEPFCFAGKYDLAGWNRTERIEHILGDDRWNFRMSGPPWLIFVMRAYRGLLFYLERLNAPVAWSIAVRPFLMQHRTELDAFDADAEQIEVGTFDGLARHLRIRVTHNGEPKVSLTFPASSVEDLHELMDDELRGRIANQGIDLAAIVKRAREFAYMPQALFSLMEDSEHKQVRVWLE